MKKILQSLEELWVAIAFAEAGAYDSLQPSTQPIYKEAVRLHAV